MPSVQDFIDGRAQFAGMNVRLRLSSDCVCHPTISQDTATQFIEELKSLITRMGMAMIDVDVSCDGFQMFSCYPQAIGGRD